MAFFVRFVNTENCNESQKGFLRRGEGVRKIYTIFYIVLD